MSPPAPEGPGSIAAARCRGCGYLHAPARQYRCLSCGGRDLEPATVALRGTIETFTVQRAGPGAEGPAGLALVRLDAGPLVTAALSINGVAPQVGARVEGVVERAPAQDMERTVERLRFALVPVPGQGGPAPSAAPSAREAPR